MDFQLLKILDIQMEVVEQTLYAKFVLENMKQILISLYIGNIVGVLKMEQKFLNIQKIKGLCKFTNI
jgi:hypothetical protein